MFDPGSNEFFDNLFGGFGGRGMGGMGMDPRMGGHTLDGSDMGRLGMDSPGMNGRFGGGGCFGGMGGYGMGVPGLDGRFGGDRFGGMGGPSMVGSGKDAPSKDGMGVDSPGMDGLSESGLGNVGPSRILRSKRRRRDVSPRLLRPERPSRYGRRKEGRQERRRHWHEEWNGIQSKLSDEGT
jgi:hypothetical protein